MKIMIYFIIIFFLSIFLSCKKEKEVIFYLQNKNIKINIIDYKNYFKDVYKKKIKIFPDTIYPLIADKEKEIFLILPGIGSNISGIFYVCKENKNYNLIFSHIDSMAIFTIDTIMIMNSHQNIKKIVSVWLHEGDIYKIFVDEIGQDSTINNIFISNDLGIPWMQEKLYEKINENYHFYFTEMKLILYMKQFLIWREKEAYLLL